MKKNLLHQIFTLTFLLASMTSFGQKGTLEIPELDTKRNVFSLKFSPDPENKEILSSYIAGSTEKDSLKFKAEISSLAERAMVTILLKDKNEEANVAIVKKHWKDIKRIGKTRNGVYQEKFDTAEEFGIIVWSDKPDVSFDMAVWTSGELPPKSGQLFYAVNKNSGGNNMAVPGINIQTDGSVDNGINGNLLTYIIIAVLVIIAILLGLILIKKRRDNTAALFIFFFFSISTLFAGAIESTARNFTQNAINYGNSEFNRLSNFANDVRQLATGGDDYSFLDKDDQEDVPDTDSAGQPQLPSSCLSSYTGRDKDASKRNSNDDSNSSKNNDNDWHENENPNSKESPNSSTNEVEFQPMQAAEGNPNDKPDNGPGEMQQATDDKSLRLPRYDQNGNLISAGDFPNAPTHIRPSGNESTQNPYLDNGTSSSQSNPTYDSNGHLKYPEEFPDAPRKIDLSTGLPVMRPVLQGQEQQGPQSAKQPLYDKNGTLIDAGDYPNAPSKIDPRKIDANAPLQNPFTGGSSEGNSNAREPKEQNQNNAISRGGSLSSNGSNTASSNYSGGNNGGSNSANSSNNNDGDNGSDSGRFGGPRNGDNGDDNDSAEKREGCDCLKKAYQRLDDRRYLFEKLRVITARIDRVTDFGLAFGDDVSGVHGVSGLVWQTKRLEIVKSMQKFDVTYEKKYQEMIKDLYDILKEIDRCEALLGFENWYSSSGFIYYTFIKDRYKRPERKF